jgi:flagellar motor protein MotB
MQPALATLFLAWSSFGSAPRIGVIYSQGAEFVLIPADDCIEFEERSVVEACKWDLLRVASLLRGAAEKQGLVIEGHTDRHPQDRETELLVSEILARIIKKFLARPESSGGGGLPAAKLVVVGYGSERPFNVNTRGRLDRRVQIRRKVHYW